MTDKKIFCPVDGSVLVFAGDHGIVDYDGDWEAQAMKYECEAGKHTIFVADSDAITEPALPAYQEAENAVYEALRGAKWNPDWKEVQLPVQEPDVLTLGQPIKSLDDLRDELAQRALTAFKDEVSESDNEEEVGWQPKDVRKT
jgi:hypothetical protein